MSFKLGITVILLRSADLLNLLTLNLAWSISGIEIRWRRLKFSAVLLQTTLSCRARPVGWNHRSFLWPRNSSKYPWSWNQYSGALTPPSETAFKIFSNKVFQQRTKVSLMLLNTGLLKVKSFEKSCLDLLKQFRSYFCHQLYSKVFAQRRMGSHYSSGIHI